MGEEGSKRGLEPRTGRFDDAFLANAENYALSRAQYLDMHRVLANRRRPGAVRAGKGKSPNL